MNELWLNLLGGVLSGVAMYLVGGLGVLRHFRRRLDALDDDNAFLAARFDRERKRAAGIKGAAAKDNSDLADELAARMQNQPVNQILEGRVKRM